MRSLTLSLDDEIYRKARIIAAQRDSFISSMVKNYLFTLADESEAPRVLKQEQEDLLDSIWKRHPAFNSSENLSREALHASRRVENPRAVEYAVMS